MVVYWPGTDTYEALPEKQAMLAALRGAIDVARDPEWAYKYAQFVIGGPWPPGEAAIARDPMWAQRYSQDVIKGPWPPGEAAIASDPQWAFGYAREVIRGPWPPGEVAIARDPMWAQRYSWLLLRLQADLGTLRSHPGNGSFPVIPIVTNSIRSGSRNLQ